MALIRWEPAREVNSLQSEMNRLFNTFFGEAGADAGGAGTEPAGAEANGQPSQPVSGQAA